MHEVAQLGTGQRLVAEVVVALNVLVPEPAAGVGGPQHGEAQGAGLGQRDGPRCQARRIGPRGGQQRLRA